MIRINVIINTSIKSVKNNILCSIYAKHYLFAEHIIYITCLFNIRSDLYQNLKNTVQDFDNENKRKRLIKKNNKETCAREAKNIQLWVHHVIKPAGMLILALIWSTVRFSLANRRGDSEEPEEGVEQVTCESRGTQKHKQCYFITMLQYIIHFLETWQ